MKTKDFLIATTLVEKAKTYSAVRCGVCFFMMLMNIIVCIICAIRFKNNYKKEMKPEATQQEVNKMATSMAIVGLFPGILPPFIMLGYWRAFEDSAQNMAGPPGTLKASDAKKGFIHGPGTASAVQQPVAGIAINGTELQAQQMAVANQQQALHNAQYQQQLALQNQQLQMQAQQLEAQKSMLAAQQQAMAAQWQAQQAQAAQYGGQVPVNNSNPAFGVYQNQQQPTPMVVQQPSEQPKPEGANPFAKKAPEAPEVPQEP